MGREYVLVSTSLLAFLLVWSVLFAGSSVVGIESAPRGAGLSLFEWNQFHGNASHAGYSRFDGPSRPILAWTYKLGGTVNGLIAKNGMLIATNPSAPAVVALAESNGTKLFDFEIQRRQYIYDWAFSTYPAAGSGLLYFSYQGWDAPSYAFYRTGGEFLDSSRLSGGLKDWSMQVSFGAADPLYGCGMVAYHEGLVYEVSFKHPQTVQNVTAFLATSGGVVWHAELLGEVDTIPTIGDDVLVVGYSNSANLTALSATNGDPLWNFVAGSSIAASPAFADGRFFFATLNGTLYSVFSNGTLAWKYDAGESVECTPAVAQGRVFFGTAIGNVYALNATSGSVLWTYATGNGLISPPVVSGNGVVFEGDSDGKLHAINASTGEGLWLYNLGARIVTSPVLDNNYLFVSDADGEIFAFASSAYDVVFEEAGLPLSTEWTVTLNNVRRSSTNSIVTFTVPEGRYSYTVEAVAGYVVTPASGEVQVEDANVHVSVSFARGWMLPSAPRSLTATASVQAILLSWSAPFDSGAPPGFSGTAIEEYHIFRGTAPGAEAYYDRVGADFLAFTDSSVNPNTVYFYVVTAKNPIGESGFSNEAGAVAVFFTVPSQPLNLTTVAQGNSVFVDWEPPQSNGGIVITQYVLYRGESSDSLVVYMTLPGNVTSYEDLSYAPSQVYFYKVLAVNTVGQSNPSNSAVVTAPQVSNESFFLDAFRKNPVGFIASVCTIVGLPIAVISVYVATRKSRREKQRE